MLCKGIPSSSLHLSKRSRAIPASQLPQQGAWTMEWNEDKGYRSMYLVGTCCLSSSTSLTSITKGVLSHTSIGRILSVFFMGVKDVIGFSRRLWTVILLANNTVLKLVASDTLCSSGWSVIGSVPYVLSSDNKTSSYSPSWIRHPFQPTEQHGWTAGDELLHIDSVTAAHKSLILVRLLIMNGEHINPLDLKWLIGLVNGVQLCCKNGK